ncbi:PEP-CTERM sorting domain-containing protein [Noviherbaspirillum sp. L7-7A]|uniref:PEP-CTERM sorting domain-containing protein n=1 Tax=Noviherbaspirillum sp. L7-7A TaxID=2850560 RepID=UPI001C2C268A|nr:PEP-CTERM sorting domain-containing protein [Noviherbaspirillum sp. L7-7A]MBV0881687.1 PEP-CTERM sorting domain-containing protein [Noviherbaspirillum sp. L7-7A]
MKALLMLLVASVLSLGTARAALIEVATPLGPDSAVLDTSSGLEWLKLSYARDVSVNQVRAAMTPGEMLEGFRYSTQDEFSCGLLKPQTGFGCGNFSASTDEAQVRAFLNLFVTGFTEWSLYSVFSPEQSRQFGWIDDYAATFGVRFYYYPEDRFPVEYDSQLFGVPLDSPQTHWLVREARDGRDVNDVPEPPMPALLGAGLLGWLGLMLRRRVRAR